MSSDNEWYWDLSRKIAVPASERGAFDHFLGPYASKHEAENWKSIAEERNENWDEKRRGVGARRRGRLSLCREDRAARTTRFRPR